MARPQTRTWDETTELAICVDLIGGTRWAAAHLGLSEESVKQALVRGYIDKGRHALILQELARQKGHDADLRKLVGFTVIEGGAPSPEPKRATRGAGRAPVRR
jgi:hypothetical protein